MKKNRASSNGGAGGSQADERIIKEHRKWTRWIEGRRLLGEGNLVLTNRRLIFLHRITSSRNVSASIKRLADAPIQSVLDYGLSLNKSNFEVPLSRVTGARIGMRARFPMGRFFLSVSYLDARDRPRRADFQFNVPRLQLFVHSQLLTDWVWVSTIKRAVKAR